MKRYQVSGECAHAMQETPLGLTQVLLYKGALLPTHTEPDRIDDLLSKGLIVEVPDPNNPIVPPSGGPTDEDAGIKVDGEYVAPGDKPAKKADDGPQVPDEKSTKAEIVDYLVAEGGNRTELNKSDKGDLVELLKARKA